MRRNAFTLIELLVVVAIISILMSILMPALGATRAQGKAAACRSNLYQLGVALQAYMSDWNDRIPFVRSPMTNGSTLAGVPGFGGNWADELVDPFDRTRWPESLPNLLMPRYIGETAGLFVCPAARVGWPKKTRPLRYTYREAAANQVNGTISRDYNPNSFVDATLTPESFSYTREHFGFMDGRIYRKDRLRLTGNAALDAEILVIQRATFLRDMVEMEGGHVVGPHKGGINVLSRAFEVEFRDQKTTNEDLAPGSVGSKF